MEDLDIREVLERLAQHEFYALLDAKFRNVAHLVQQTGTPGEITIKLKINPGKPGEPMLTIEEHITEKLPAEPVRGGFVFMADGRFSESDPRTPQLPMGRSVERGESNRRVGE